MLFCLDEISAPATTDSFESSALPWAVVGSGARRAEVRFGRGGQGADLHDLPEAVLDVGGEGGGDIGGDGGDADALRDHLDRLLGNDAHPALLPPPRSPGSRKP